jgi:hypothetical protein
MTQKSNRSATVDATLKVLFDDGIIRNCAISS